MKCILSVLIGLLIHPLTLVSQSKAEMLQVIRILPKDAFMYALEAINDEERTRLIENGKGANWTVEILREDFLKLTYNETSDHFIRIKKLKCNSGNNLIIVHTEQGQNHTMECFMQDGKTGWYKKKEFLPDIKANEFLDKNYLPANHPLTASFLMEDNGRITAYLNFWMEPDFEERQIAFTVWLEWNGETFTVKKEPIR